MMQGALRPPLGKIGSPEPRLPESPGSINSPCNYPYLFVSRPQIASLRNWGQSCDCQTLWRQADLPLRDAGGCRNYCHNLDFLLICRLIMPSTLKGRLERARPLIGSTRARGCLAPIGGERHNTAAKSRFIPQVPRGNHALIMMDSPWIIMRRGSKSSLSIKLSSIRSNSITKLIPFFM
jgi:hypothetical protein